MKNEVPRDPDKNTLPALEAAGEAAIAGLLATIDPSAGVLGGAAIAGLNATKGMRLWLRVLREEIAEGDTVLDATDPRLVAAFNTLTVGAMQTSRDEKRRLLAAALLNSGSAAPESDFIVEQFANLAVRFSPEHVRVMQVMANPAAFGIEERHVEAEHVAHALYPEATPEEHAEAIVIVEFAWTDVVAVGLAMDGYLNGFMSDLREEILVDGLSSKGHRFLAYLNCDDPASRV